jgi:hypothetical protein
MKIMVLGSAPSSRDKSAIGEAGRRIGDAIAAIHESELIVCSPFDDALDRHVFQAASRARAGMVVHVHAPDLPARPGANTVAEEWHKLGVPNPRLHEEAGSDSWFMAQVHAQREADAIILLGGKLSASARLLVAVAQERGLPVLPFSFLGGLGAAVRFDGLTEYRARLDDHAELLDDEKGLEVIEMLLRRLVDSTRASRGPIGPTDHRCFISYSRARPAEADLVETVLRREGLLVFRDEHAFEVGSDVPGKIKHALENATVFIALWCAEYACSPHCYDELYTAIELRQRTALPKIWLIRLDQTRIVPPIARPLLYEDAADRVSLERLLAKLLGQLR